VPFFEPATISTEKYPGTDESKGIEKHKNKIVFFDICVKNLSFLIITENLFNIKSISAANDAKDTTLRPMLFM